MDYNSFYRRKDQRRRKRSPEEKENLRRLVLFTLKSIAIGIIAGGVLVFVIPDSQVKPLGMASW
ncbi:MAG: hypothetical protein PHW26_01845 [Eubacteriales bacterium]|nr:hypothetical protein [Eubacteriales bacterium]